MKRVTAALLLGLVSASALADDVNTAVPRDLYFGVLGDYLALPYSSRDPKLDNGIGGELFIGSREKADALPFGLGWEVRTFYGEMSVKKPSGLENRRRTGVSGDVTYPFYNLNTGPVLPYVLGGVGLVYSNDVRDLSNEFSMLLEVGGGVVSKPLFSWGWRARGEIREVIENYANGYFDTHVLIGIEIPLSHGAMPPPAPEPVKVVESAPPPAEPAPAPAPAEAPPPPDSDGDGVPDPSDKCPNTPKGEAVDADGCPTTVKKVITLKGVNFEVNSDVLKPESEPVLDEAVQTLNNEYPDARVEVAGHTDSSGKPEYNMELSRRRAESVRKYMVEHGVDAGRLTSAGYGMTQPVADNKTKAGKSKNRRVELRIK